MKVEKCIRLITGQLFFEHRTDEFLCEAGRHPLRCCGRNYSAVKNDGRQRRQAQNDGSIKTASEGRD